MLKSNTSAKIKQLTLLLFVSGSFNIFLFAFLFYWVFKEQPPTPYCELMPKAGVVKEVACNLQIANKVRYLKTLKFQDLRLKLSDPTEMEGSIKVRDLALAILCSFHNFDLKKALGNTAYSLKQKVLVWGNGLEKLPVFTEMDDLKFKAVIEFASNEKWPFKTAGLFQHLKKDPKFSDPSLIDTFLLTPEFGTVKTLFLRSGHQVNPQELLKVIVEGSWGLLSAFHEKQKKGQDLSDGSRRQFLLDYIKIGSRSAAHLLLRTDFDFALRNTKDETVLAILQLVEKCEEMRQFALATLSLQRGESTRKMAELRLEEYISLSKVIQDQVLTSLKPKEQVPLKIPVKKPAPVRKEQVYTIQEGDSLWKIAKKFHLSVEHIKCYNRMNSDLLQPGTTLKIPETG